VIPLFMNIRTGTQEKVLRGEANEDLTQMIARLEGDGWSITGVPYTEMVDARTNGIVLEAKV